MMHGANAPLMKIMVAEQMERERRILAGEELRRGIPMHEAVPGTKVSSRILPELRLVIPKYEAVPGTYRGVTTNSARAETWHSHA